MPPKITFHGAARTVTGSRHLIEDNSRKILVDCGLFQGPQAIRAKNWEDFPVDVQKLDAIIVTHAHLDHVGFLPRLARLGYRGPVYATPGTIRLARISLPDAANLQQERADDYNRHGISRHTPAQPLYTVDDSRAALKLFEKVHYYQWQELPGKMQFRFLPAGHILGSAFAEIYFENGEKIVMGADLGRYDRPIIVDPTVVDWTEYLVIESTYGDRVHSNRDAKEEIYQVLKYASDTGSPVIVPSFAIGRTQEMLWYVHLLEKEGRLPDMPIYVDSPMATATTLLYSESDEEHDRDMKIDMRQGKSPFREDMVTSVHSREQSKALNDKKGPFMVIAGSGMATGGRVLHHLRAHAWKPETVILFTGYQAEGTLGRQIQDGASEVTIMKTPVDVRAKIRTLDMLSAHPDSVEMLKWLGNFRQPPKKTFIVHGDEKASLALQAHIKLRFPDWHTEVPEQGQTFNLS